MMTAFVVQEIFTVNFFEEVLSSDLIIFKGQGDIKIIDALVADFPS